MTDWKKRIQEADKIRLVITPSFTRFKSWCREHKRMAGVDAIWVDDQYAVAGRDGMKYQAVILSDAGSIEPGKYRLIILALEHNRISYRNDMDSRIKSSKKSSDKSTTL